MALSNRELANILYEMAALYEMEGVQFKPRAYERAAQGVESFDEPVFELFKRGGAKALTTIPGVGAGIADHIASLLAGKKFKEYEILKKKVPVNILELISVEGVGPRMVKVLWEKLKIKDLADLEKAAREGKIRSLPRFGERTEQRILRGIEFLKKSSGRQILGFVLPEVRQLLSAVRAIPEVKDAEIAGSTRRMKETIGDIDIFAISTKPERVMERFVRLPYVAHVYSQGPTKTMVKLKNGLDADLRVVEERSFGAALLYFTGSKEHNVALRELAIKKGWKLNEYGLFEGSKMIAGRTENEIYDKLGLEFIPPELRENSGEIEAAMRKGSGRGLPTLIGYGDLKGDLQVQTNWTDGEDSIEEMARAAEKMGLEYIAITDHTRSLAMTGGADEKKLLSQMAEIDKTNAVLKRSGRKIEVLKGAEVNVGKDGLLDIADEVLKKLDVVGAAVHSHFNLSRDEQTKRIIRAMENPNVDIIFHLTTRVIQKREPIELDIEAIIKAAKRTGTVLEIDAYPDRLDIRDEYIKKCVEAGVLMCIDSDAHSAEHFKYLEIGIAQARRGWAKKEDIVNAWPLSKMKKMLKDNA